MQYAESQRYRQRRGARGARGAGGIMSTIDSFFQHKEMKNAQAQQDAFDNANSMMRAVGQGTLKPNAPAISDVLLRLQHYDPERANLFANEIKHVREGRTRAGYDAVQRVSEEMGADANLTQCAAIARLSNLDQMRILQMEGANEYWREPCPEEIAADKRKALTTTTRNILKDIGADPKTILRVMGELNLLEDGTIGALLRGHLAQDERIRAEDEAEDKRAQAERERVQTIADEKLEKEYREEGGWKDLNAIYEAQNRAMVGAVNQIYDEQMSAYKDSVKANEDWDPKLSEMFEEEPGRYPLVQPKILPRPRKSEIRKRLFPNMEDDFAAQLGRLAAQKDWVKRRIRGEPEPAPQPEPEPEAREGVVGELTNYDPPSQARLMVNSIAQNLPDAAAKIMRDGLAEAIKEGQVDRFLQDLLTELPGPILRRIQREFPQAFQPGG